MYDTSTPPLAPLTSPVMVASASSAPVTFASPEMKAASSRAEKRAARSDLRRPWPPELPLFPLFALSYSYPSRSDELQTYPGPGGAGGGGGEGRDIVTS